MEKILIIVGGKNDVPHLNEVVKLFKKNKINFEIKVISAHRNIDILVRELEPRKIEKEGIKVILAVAHSVSNLPAIIAGYMKDTKISVIGVGLTKSDSDTIASLLSIQSIPSGIPLANCGVNKVGLNNAALFCIKLLKS